MRLVYQSGDTVNVVNGALPKENPDMQVGFTGGASDWVITFIKIGGVNIPIKSAGGTVEMTDSISLNGVDMSVPNPDLVTTLVDGNYDITGTMAVAPDSVCTAWGYPTGTNLFTVKVVFEGDIDPETFSGTCSGKVPDKPILYSKFDGPNYINYIFDGSTKVITIKYKANEDAEEKTIVINNNATLAGAED